MDQARPQTFILAICGPSGSGKSTLSQAIYDRYAQHACRVPLDHYYRDLSALSMSKRAKVNFDHPDSLDHTLLIEQVKQLKAGHAVKQPVYDFATHCRLAHAQQVDAKPLVIIEGILALHWPQLNALIDYSVYVDTPWALCKARRIARDIKERGRDLASIEKQLQETVLPMTKQFVLPQQTKADECVCHRSPEDLTRSLEKIIQYLKDFGLLENGHRK